MKKRQKLLADEQWELVEPMLPPPRRRGDNRGRPWASNRGCFEGILWILQTGAAWRFLPEEFPSPSTCWRPTDISNAPVDPNSANIINLIGPTVTLHPDFGAGTYRNQTIGIPYQVV